MNQKSKNLNYMRSAMLPKKLMQPSSSYAINIATAKFVFIN